MLPYFFVMSILAMYGIHRYALVYNYFKHRKNVPGPPPEVERGRKVTVQLPIYNERYVIERLIEAVAQFDYPRELLEIQVLDDSTDETQQVARDCVERYQALGVPITYLHRDNREGFKAGALQEGLKTATGEFVAIFDADFIPPADFLRRTVPYFADPKIGDGADALELHQPQLLRADRSGSDSARRALRDRALVALPQRPIFQFQRHGRNLAPRRDRRRRRLAARHADRRHRPFLPRADQRLAISLFAGDRLPVRTAGGNERLQIAAGALGQGPDADGQEDSAARAAIGRAYGGEGRGGVSPDGKYQLPADGFSCRSFCCPR